MIKRVVKLGVKKLLNLRVGFFNSTLLALVDVHKMVPLISDVFGSCFGFSSNNFAMGLFYLFVHFFSFSKTAVLPVPPAAMELKNCLRRPVKTIH